MKFHPDRNPNDSDAEEKFKEAKEASEILSDAQKRAAYDQFGHAGLEARGRRAVPRMPSAISSAMCSATSSAPHAAVAARRSIAARICASSWSSIWRRRCSARPLRSRCRSSPSARPATAPAPPRAARPRPATPAAARATCACRRASFSCSRPARAAAASGTIVRNPCDTCLGQGRVRRTRKLSVKVPGGVDSGDRIRLAGEGEAGRNGGPAGDLYVEVQVREHRASSSATAST